MLLLYISLRKWNIKKLNYTLFMHVTQTIKSLHVKKVYLKLEATTALTSWSKQTCSIPQRFNLNTMYYFAN